MFTSLLPGFREVRTPLVTGYLYLLWAWMVWGDGIDFAAHPGGFLGRVYGLAGASGAASTLAAISFAAYLLGSLFEIRSFRSAENSTYAILAVLDRAKRRNPYWSHLTYYRNYPGVIWHHVFRLLARAWPAAEKDDFSDVANFSGHIITNFLDPDYPVTSRRYQQVQQAKAKGDPNELRKLKLMQTCDGIAQSIRADLPGLGLRLQLENERLYNDYDRNMAEAGLRFSVFIPGFVMMWTFAAWRGPWPLLAFPLLIFLLLQGMRRELKAERILWNAVIMGVLKPPVIEKLESMAQAQEG